MPLGRYEVNVIRVYALHEDPESARLTWTGKGVWNDSDEKDFSISEELLACRNTHISVLAWFLAIPVNSNCE